MSASRAFRSAANSLAGSNLTRTRIASTFSGPRPSVPLRHAYFSSSFGHQRATATTGLSPGARAIIATTRGVRNILIIATSTLAIGYFFFAGTHAYLEQYKCPSPQGVSTQVQRCLHGAWVREEISPDPDVAELYLQKAIEMARQDLKTHYANRNKKNVDQGQQQQDERLAFLEIEKDQALVEIQNRLARFYGRIGRDEQAATVWTRLWKLSEKENPRSSSSSDEQSSGLGSLFGGASVNRPLISRRDAIPYSKSAADCWMRMGEYEMAEEALAWTLSTLTSTTSSSTTSTSRIEEIGLLSTLGALYVRQAKYEYALSLFVKALQAVQDHRAQNDKPIEATAGAAGDKATVAALKENRDMWYCREAILTQSIGETLYGAATRSPSSSSTTATTTTTTAMEPKKSSSWKFWSSSSSSSSTTSKSPKVTSQKSPEQLKKEEEALGWMQKALAMAKVKSGEHRDCDECAALGLNNLGLINE
ncbi:hypothetical protein BGZ95_009498, partial [Linnemannia exigua]